MVPVLMPCPSPATWALADYPNQWTQDGIFVFAGQNGLDPRPGAPYQGGPILVLIDAALIICPAQPAIPDIDVVPESLYYQQNSYTVVPYLDQIIICNTGSGPLTINSITSDHPWIIAGPFISPLAPGQCDSVDVIINTFGIAPNFYTGNFHVSSNDPDEAVVNEPWYIVRVIEPDINVTPDSLYHLQQVNIVITHVADFQIQNLGSAVLTYSVSNTLPWITFAGVSGFIFPGAYDDIDITINTNGILPGTYIDSLTVLSDDPDEPVVRRPKIVVDVFRLPPDSLYWKDFNGTDADGGYMPDFDQWQMFVPGFCGPFSIANSLWWFQGKFPQRIIVPPQFYPQDPAGFATFLAGLMGTNSGRAPGTYVDSMQLGIAQYIQMMGLADLLYEHTVYQPPFELVEAEIERCQDVTLLIGFWQVVAVFPMGPDQWIVYWQRQGGHYVSAAGVNSALHLIGLSDPAFDNFEAGICNGILRGFNHDHPYGHNDGVSASHDIYPVNNAMVCSPGGVWELEHTFWHNPGLGSEFFRQNGDTANIDMLWPCSYPPQPGMMFSEIEAAVIVSPYAAVPDIDVLPDSVFHSLTEGDIENYLGDFSINNLGTAPLNWSATNSLSWLILGTTAGILNPGEGILNNVSVDASTIVPGTYVDTVRISSDDPDEPLVLKPIYVIEVIPEEVECDYIPGDINGVPPANGIDVTYGVSYLKGGNRPPIDCGTPVGPCPQASPFYAAMDVNGSCTTNGIDITYFVSYLKGGPALMYCPTCPPALITLPATEPPTKEHSTIEEGGTIGK
jgi:hypothetical protein